jgi:hypothetical protein
MEEIRKAITELPIEELKKYLEETIWEGIEEDSPEEEELDKIRDEAMEPFLLGYDNNDTREGYNKLTSIMVNDIGVAPGWGNYVESYKQRE